MGKPVFAGLQIQGTEQPAHLCSLISAIVKRLLQSIVSNRPKGNFQCSSNVIAEQTGLSRASVDLSPHRVSHDGAHSLMPLTTKIHSQFGAKFLWFTDLTISRGYVL